MKRLWAVLASVKLTFWLLLVAMALFLFASFYANNHFAFFHTLNKMRVQDWMRLNLGARPDIAWWLPLLLATMTLLGLNTFACAVNRVITLLHGKKGRPLYAFFLALIPTLIHGLFLVILLGHLMTLTLGSWKRVALRPNQEITALGTGSKVTAVQHDFFPQGSALGQRISQSRATLATPRGEITLSFMKPLFYQGRRLFLDMEKKRKEDSPPKESLIAQDRENCNKAPLFHTKSPAQAPALFLLMVSDPGLPVIVSGFTLILILMVWHFMAAGHKSSPPSKKP